MNEARARHETINRRLKNYDILKQQYRHSVELHCAVLHAVAVVVQMGFELGEDLWQVEYDDRQFLPAEEEEEEEEEEDEEEEEEVEEEEE
jgi:hypothetical protein